jgi:hypothetical protein
MTDFSITSMPLPPSFTSIRDTDSDSDAEEIEDMIASPRKDKGKGKMRYLPELPEEVWRRIWAFYYGRCAEGELEFFGPRWYRQLTVRMA